jgi:hypothetical protein
MTTTWTIINTKYQIADGLVTEVVYICQASLENELSRKVGRISLTGDPTAPGFVAFENLTEQMIIEWVQSVLGQIQVTEIETALQDKVTAQKAAKDAQTVKNGLPWQL